MRTWAFLLALLTFPSGALADGGWTLDQEFAYERLSVLNGDGDLGPMFSDIEWRLRSETIGRYERKFETGHILVFEPSIKITGYTDERELDRIELDVAGEYRLEIDPWNNVQFRAQGQLTYASDGGRTVFTRARAGAHIRYRHRPENQTFARLRLGYRDQNEATFEGFDQTETLIEFGHDFRPRRDRFMMQAVAYGDFRVADDPAFSSDEFGFRAWVRYPVSELVEVTGRLNAYDRRYGGSFSADYTQNRHDRRLKAEVSVDYRMTDNMAIFVAGGFDINDSNIPIRDYAGPTIGIGLVFSRDF